MEIYDQLHLSVRCGVENPEVIIKIGGLAPLL
jgi:hypothetical protein